ncbi:hypothetical protein L195_g050280 [Trifolium pratense]|uniref:Uncharacterized protein n=1 Tax=Trifolium pratense TaxID=57577 RepID=A0A2K3JT32_TRIPR|nr:hypothetical protein L195_g050280 [Trifolium pratense]
MLFFFSYHLCSELMGRLLLPVSIMCQSGESLRLLTETRSHISFLNQKSWFKDLGLYGAYSGATATMGIVYCHRLGLYGAYSGATATMDIVFCHRWKWSPNLFSTDLGLVTYDLDLFVDMLILPVPSPSAPLNSDCLARNGLLA